MMTCPFCRALIPDDSHYCDQCGTQLHFCPECRKPKRGTQCAVCGTDLVGAEEFFGAAASESKALSLRSDKLTLALKEGQFGRTGGIYPELSTDIYVSGRHGELRRQGGEWQIRDLGSTNGTFVNGTRLQRDAWTPLHEGDCVKIATNTYHVKG